MVVTANHIVDGRNNMADEASILCWSGGWGLPSLDPACLQALVRFITIYLISVCVFSIYLVIW